MHVRGLLDAAGLEGQAEAALQRGTADGFRGGGGALATVAFGGEEQRGMTMSFPLFPQALEGAFGQRDVAVLIALATADVEEHAFGINVAYLEAQPFAQAQALESFFRSLSRQSFADLPLFVMQNWLP